MAISIKNWFKAGGWLNVLFLALIVYVVNEAKTSMASGYVTQAMSRQVNTEQDRRLGVLEQLPAEISELKALARENNVLLRQHINAKP